ncbi:uncharacterized protein LOC143282439 [Babylonia areolata]|uniref:uncharacterized protein LOC143282439 n=1 Tax=Babylonia areolata TaxID=304850 RepID=UPI003FD2BB13
MGCGGSKQTTVDDQAKKGNNSPNKKGNNAASPRGKYMVNGSSARSGDSASSGATDKGFKRRIREKLQAATAGNDIPELEKAVDRFERHHLEDCGDLSRAKDRLEFLRLRRDLRDGIRRSHVGVLEKTITAAERSQFSGQLHNQIEAARRKLQHLKELNEYRHDILSMEQTTISEIHSYQRPPACVHDVMAATYMLLGHSEPYLTDWADIQTLLCRVGRDSLIHGVREFDSAHVDEQTSGRVQDILRPHDLHTVRQASNGAAAFYVWNTQICEKVERDKKEEEERLRQQELERQKQEERDAKNPKNKNSRKPKG